MSDEKRSDGLGISGFTLGVLSIIFCIFNGLIGISMGIVGLIFCIIQQRKHKMSLGKVGIILNTIGILLSIIIVILYIWLLPYINQFLPTA